MSGSTFSYGVFNKPLSITRSGGDSSAFAYGIERDCYRRVDQMAVTQLPPCTWAARS